MKQQRKRGNPQLPELVAALIKESENDFSHTIEDLLTRFGWQWVHSRPARTIDGWRTALSGMQGFPDYFAVKGKRALAIELKSDTGELSPEQYFWLVDLTEAGIECYLWQPKDDFNEIVAILK